MDFIKNILKNVVSNIIAFFISIIIIFFIFTAIVSIISSTDDTNKTIEVKSNSVLLIDDLNIIGDRDLMGEDFDLDIGISIPGVNDDVNKEKISIKTFQTIIDSAKNDPKIKSIYLNIDNAPVPFNKLKQVRDILSSFRKVKPIYSFSDFYSKSAYYLSSVSNFFISWGRSLQGFDMNLCDGA